VNVTFGPFGIVVLFVLLVSVCISLWVIAGSRARRKERERRSIEAEQVRDSVVTQNFEYVLTAARGLSELVSDPLEGWKKVPHDNLAYISIGVIGDCDYDLFRLFREKVVEKARNNNTEVDVSCTPYHVRRMVKSVEELILLLNREELTLNKILDGAEVSAPYAYIDVNIERNELYVLLDTNDLSEDELSKIGLMIGGKRVYVSQAGEFRQPISSNEERGNWRSSDIPYDGKLEFFLYSGSEEAADSAAA